MDPWRSLLLAFVALFAACSGPTPSRSTATPAETPTLSSKAHTPRHSAGDATPATPRVSPSPSWLGDKVLPVGEDGLGIATSTPRSLRDRRLVTTDHLPAPDGERFASTIGEVPPEVLRRSTWHRSCPVASDDLAYVTVSFWGFDRAAHTGELIVNASVAPDVVSVFRSLHKARWPIEEMRVTSRGELNAPPTGDGNNTSAFVCRPARLSGAWSQHAYGLAVDINPFHNPYVRGRLVLPERAVAYRDRTWRRPGMIRDGDVVTAAFDRIGWGWGGEWSSAKDWMHFSRSGG